MRRNDGTEIQKKPEIKSCSKQCHVKCNMEMRGITCRIDTTKGYISHIDLVNATRRIVGSPPSIVSHVVIIAKINASGV